MKDKPEPNPDIMDLNKPIPEDYKTLVNEMKEVLRQGTSGLKRCYWNLGRYVSAFMNGTREERYGKETIEGLARDLDVPKSHLYETSKIYEAYDNKDLAVALGRDKVAATHMVHLAKIQDTTVRDQIERRIQQEGLTKPDVVMIINQALVEEQTKSTASDKRARGPSVIAATNKATKNIVGAAELAIKKQDPIEAWEMANAVSESFREDVISDTCVKIQGGIQKKAADPGEVPEEIHQAAIVHIREVEALHKILGKYLEKMQKYWQG